MKFQTWTHPKTGEDRIYVNGVANKGVKAMKNVQTNIAELEEARAEVLAHCMCAKLAEEKDRFIVFFPMGFQVDAAQMRFAQEGVSKTNALRLLLATMEKYWRLA